MEFEGEEGMVSGFLYSIILRSIHGIVLIIVHSFFITEYYSIVWIYYNLFIYSSVNRHLCYFKFLIVADKAAVNIYGQVLCVDICFCFSWVNI